MVERAKQVPVEPCVMDRDRFARDAQCRHVVGQRFAYGEHACSRGSGALQGLAAISACAPEMDIRAARLHR